MESMNSISSILKLDLMTIIRRNEAKKKTIPTASLSGLRIDMMIMVMRKMLMRMDALLSYFWIMSVM
jgi:hypothetical protein